MAIVFNPLIHGVTIQIKPCCLDRLASTIQKTATDDNPAVGRVESFYFSLLSDMKGLTVTPSKTSMAGQGGLAYLQCYSQVKNNLDAHKHYPFPENERFSEMLIFNDNELGELRRRGYLFDLPHCRISLLRNLSRVESGYGTSMTYSKFRLEFRMTLALYEEMLSQLEAENWPLIKPLHIKGSKPYFVFQTEVLNTYALNRLHTTARLFQEIVSVPDQLSPGQQKLARSTMKLLKSSFQGYPIKRAPMLWKSQYRSRFTRAKVMDKLIRELEEGAHEDEDEDAGLPSELVGPGHERKGQSEVQHLSSPDCSLGLGIGDSLEKYRVAWIPSGLIDFSKNTFANDEGFDCPPSTLQKKLKLKSKVMPIAEEWLKIQSILDRVIEAISDEWHDGEELSRKSRWLVHYASIFILATYSTDIARACYASTASFPTKEQYLVDHPEARIRYGGKSGIGAQLKDIRPFGLHFPGIEDLLGQPPSGCRYGSLNKKKDVFENTFFPAFDIMDSRNSGWARAFSTKAAKYMGERLPTALVQIWKNVFESQFICSVHTTLSHQNRKYCGSRSKDKSLTFLGFSADGTRLDMTNDDHVKISGWKMPWGLHTIVDDIAFGMSIEEALRDDILNTLVSISIDERKEMRYKRA
jgi:hypothetical protein